MEKNTTNPQQVTPFTHPEFFPIPARGLDPYFGIGRSSYYDLEKRGLLRLIRIRKPGNIRGRVLVPYADVSALIRKLSEDDGQAAQAPVQSAKSSCDTDANPRVGNPWTEIPEGTPVMLWRGEESFQLVQDPPALALLTLIAPRARYTPNSLDGLTVGQAHIGDWNACGLTRKQYRCAMARLERMGLCSFLSIKGRGTIATILDDRIYAIHGPEPEEPEGAEEMEMALRSVARFNAKRSENHKNQP